VELKVHNYDSGDQPAPGEQTWDTGALQRDFTVHSFVAPYVVVTRKSDNAAGIMQFQHNPRVYWGFRSADEMDEQ